MANYDLAHTYIQTLTGENPETAVVDFRAIHDKRKDIPAHHFRGTLPQLWATLEQYNANGYGIFCNINALDGNGRELSNVAYIRTHVVDLDNPLNAHGNYERAAASAPYPHFAVQTSPGKYHIYWLVEPYTGNDFYTIHQRKFRQLYDGDRNVIDATRVLRVPGFFHQKGEPFEVTLWALGGLIGPRHPAAVIQQALAAVNVVENYGGLRHPLGEASLTAPSLEWLKFAIRMVDPNQLSRDEWVSFTSAIKQAGWNHVSEPELHAIWKEWCSQYTGDRSDEEKLWNSIRDTEVGWGSIERRTPVRAYMDFGFQQPPQPAQGSAVSLPENETNPSNHADNIGTKTGISNPSDAIMTDTSGEILDHWGCKEWFKGCYFIERMGEIFSPNGRFMNSTEFNGKYGGKHFVITSTGKTTDEAWKAALRSTCYTIPKVDHVRFLPDHPPFTVIEDNLGRKGLNTYIPAKVHAAPGDVSIWLEHIRHILPHENDQHIFLSYLAHAVKYPGFKIPWAPMLQSVEGIGKTVFSEVLEYALGDMYVYSPKAPELIKSGSTFNAWMRAKLMIIVNEIKIDEKRELIEILKPMITDSRVEIQSKGVDQEMEDNLANWLFFSNYKDAIPINQNGRRYCIMYSALQSKEDLVAAGMTDVYFNRLWSWLREGGGKAAIAYWLKNYPIEKGGLPVRAPQSSSHEEAIRISRSPMEIAIEEAVGDNLPGFKGGYVSVTAALNRCKTVGGMRAPIARSVQNCLESMGYVELGRAERPYMQEDAKIRPIIYGKRSNLPVAAYGQAQGYE